MLRPFVLLLVLLPTAQACSFEREPPGPGMFYVWDTEGDPVAVSVHRRGLGGTCELSNANAVDDERFAWVEGDTILVVELATRQRSQVPWAGGHPQGISVVGDRLFVQENLGVHDHKVWSVADDGTRTLAYATQTYGRLAGAYYVTQQDGVGIVDVRNGEEVAAPKTAAQRGFVGDEPGFVGTDGRYLVYQEARNGATRYHIHDLEGGAWRQVERAGYTVWDQVGDGSLYSLREENLTVIDLASGRVGYAAVPRIAMLGAGSGHVVLGAYSASEVAGAWQELRVVDPEEHVPASVALLALAAAAVAVARRR